MIKNKFLWIFWGLTFISFFFILANKFITPIPSWGIRVAGFVAIASLIGIGYQTVKNK